MLTILMLGLIHDPVKIMYLKTVQNNVWVGGPYHSYSSLKSLSVFIVTWILFISDKCFQHSFCVVVFKNLYIFFLKFIYVGDTWFTFTLNQIIGMVVVRKYYSSSNKLNVSLSLHLFLCFGLILILPFRMNLLLDAQNYVNISSTG